MTLPAIDLTVFAGAVVGPTASGKSSLALALARRHHLEMVSVDSMQVYRGMDIGTAKPTAAEQMLARHHLIDIADPADDFGVAQFQQHLMAVVADLRHRDARALLVGGTGLYFQAAVDGFAIPGQYPNVRAELECEPETAVLHTRLARLDPVAAARMEPSNRRRVIRALEVTLGSGQPFSSAGPGVATFPALPFPVIAIRRSRDSFEPRLRARLTTQFADGFLAEVVGLQGMSRPMGRTARQALGYRELIDYFEQANELHADQGRSGAAVSSSVPPAVWERIISRSRQFAVRQERWFRRDPRVVWVDGPTDPTNEATLIDVADEMIAAGRGTNG